MIFRQLALILLFTILNLSPKVIGRSVGENVPGFIEDLLHTGESLMRQGKPDCHDLFHVRYCPGFLCLQATGQSIHSGIHPLRGCKMFSGETSPHPSVPDFIKEGQAHHLQNIFAVRGMDAFTQQIDGPESLNRKIISRTPS